LKVNGDFAGFNRSVYDARKARVDAESVFVHILDNVSSNDILRRTKLIYYLEQKIHLFSFFTMNANICALWKRKILLPLIAMDVDEVAEIDFSFP
jgi:hypothetical protein